MKLKEILKKGTNAYEYKYIHQMIYRYISLPFIWLFLKLRLTPNFITFLGIVLKLTGLYFYITFLKLPAVILYQFGTMIDWCDGAVARITKKTSELGVFLDSMSDLLLKRIFPVALAVGLFYFYKEELILIIALILFVLVTIREMIYLHPKRSKDDSYFTEREGIKSRYSVFSRIFTAIIDFNKVFFPFIILFDLRLIYAFYFFNMFIESLRIMFDIYSTFCGSIRK